MALSSYGILKHFLSRNQLFKCDSFKIRVFEISILNDSILASFEDRGLWDGLFCHEFHLVYASACNFTPIKRDLFCKLSHFSNHFIIRYRGNCCQHHMINKSKT